MGCGHFYLHPSIPSIPAMLSLGNQFVFWILFFFSIGNKELLRERRISRRSVSEDKCCEGPNILSCTSYDVSADLVQSQSEEISIHGYNLKFLRKVQPNGLVYTNDNGDEAVLSIRKRKSFDIF